MSNVAAGKDTDDEGEMINDVEKTLKSMNVQLRTSVGEWRNFEEVLDEVAQKWNNGAFNDVEKSKIATAIAGVRQQENFRALMNNYDEVITLTGVAEKSTGSASEKMSIYLDSVESKVKELEATWEEFIIRLNQSDSYKGAIDILIYLVENLPTVIGLVTGLAIAWKSWSVIARISRQNEAAITMQTIATNTQAMADELAAAAKNNSTIAINAETTAIQTNTTAENANQIAGQSSLTTDNLQTQAKNTETAAIQANTAAIQANTAAESANQIAGQMSIDMIGKQNMLQGTQLSLFTKKISGAKTMTGTFTKVAGTASKTTQTLGSSLSNAASGASGLTGVFAKLASGLGKIGLVVGAGMTIVNAFKQVHNSIKQAQLETVSETQKAIDSLQDESDTLDDLRLKVNEAYKSTTTLEEKTTLLKSAQETLNSTFETQIGKLGETKTANDLLNSSYEKTLGLLNELEMKNIEDKVTEYALGADDRNHLLDDDTTNDLGIGGYLADTNGDGIGDKATAYDSKYQDVINLIEEVVTQKGGRMWRGMDNLHVKTDEARTQVEIYRELMNRAESLSEEQKEMLGKMVGHSSLTEKSMKDDANKYGEAYDQEQDYEVKKYISNNKDEYLEYKNILAKRKDLHNEYLKAETEAEKQNLLDQINDLEPEIRKKEEALMKNTYGNASLQNRVKDGLSSYNIEGLGNNLDWSKVEGVSFEDWDALQKKIRESETLTEELKNKILEVRDAVKATGNEEALTEFDNKLKALGISASDSIKSIQDIRKGVIGKNITVYDQDENGQITSRRVSEFENFEIQEEELLNHLKEAGVNFNQKWYDNLKEKFKNGEVDGKQFFDALTTMAKTFGVDLENSISEPLDRTSSKKLKLNYENSGGTDTQFQNQVEETSNLYNIADKIDDGKASYKEIRHLTDNYEEFLDTVEKGNKITGKQVRKFADKMVDDINEDLDIMIENAESYADSLEKIMSKGSKVITKDNERMASSLSDAMQDAADAAEDALKDENKDLEFVDTTKVSGDLEMIKDRLNDIEVAADDAGAAAQFFSAALDIANDGTQEEILLGMADGFSGLSAEQWNAIYSSDEFQTSLANLTEQEGFLNSETHGVLMELGLVDEQGNILKTDSATLGAALETLSGKFSGLGVEAQSAASSILSAAYSQGVMNNSINGATAEQVINLSGKTIATAKVAARGTASEGYARKYANNTNRNSGKGKGSGSKKGSDYSAEDAANDLKDILNDIEKYEEDIELDLEDQTEQFINQEMLAANRLDTLKEELDYYNDIYDVTENTSKWLETQNKLLDNQSKKVGSLQNAQASIDAQRKKLIKQNSNYNVESWFDSEGNDTLAYGDLINSFEYKKEAIERDTAAKMRAVYNRVSGSKDKDTIKNAKDEIKRIEEEADIKIKALDKEQEKVEKIHDSVGELNDAWKDNQEAIRDALKELHDLVKSMRDELLDDITEQLEKAVDRTNKSLEKSVTRMEQLVTIQEKSNDILNETIDTQQELDSELQASLDSFEYLDEQMRELMFNEDDYKVLSETLTGIQEDVASIWEDHYKQIDELTDDTMYKAEYITAETERQLDMKMREYELAKAELDVAKARTNLQNVKNERNVRMFVGGQWIWTADPNAVKDAQQQLADAEREKTRIEREAEQQRLLDKMNKMIDSDNLQIDENNELLERIQEAIEEQTTEVKSIEDALANASGQDLPALNDVLQGAFGKDGGDFKEIMNNLNKGQTALAAALDGKTTEQAEAQLKRNDMSKSEFEALVKKLGYGWDEKTGTVTTWDGSFKAHYKGWKDTSKPNTPLGTGSNGASVTGGGANGGSSGGGNSGGGNNQPTSTQSLDAIAKEVIRGKWGNGTERRRRLTAAGYDYNAVQSVVNQLKRQGYFDLGGLATGKGILLKDVKSPERVLSPQQTKSFDRLVDNLTSNPVLQALTKNVKGTSSLKGLVGGSGETKQYYFSNFTVKADNLTEFIDSLEGMIPITNK